MLFIPNYAASKNNKSPEKKNGSGGETAAPSASPAPAKTKRKLPALGSKPAGNGSAFRLPPIEFLGRINYLQSFDLAEAACAAIVASSPAAIGLDVEWRVTFQAGEAPRRTATVQICAPEPSAADPLDVRSWVCHVLHVCHMGDALPPSLLVLMGSERVLKAGVGVEGDAWRLEKEHAALLGRVAGVANLSRIWQRKLGLGHTGALSLQGLCESALGRSLSKDAAFRLSNWEARPLSPEQLSYAATDAYVSLKLFHALSAIPDCVWPVPPPPPPAEQAVADGVAPDSAVSAAAAAGADGATVGSARAGGGDNDGSSDGSGGGAESAGTAASTAAATAATPPIRGPSFVPALPTCKRLAPAKLAVYELFVVRGASLAAIAAARGNKVGTVANYLIEAVSAGLAYEWAALDAELPAGFETVARAAVAALGGSTCLRLKDVKEALPLQLAVAAEYWHIALVLEHMKREAAAPMAAVGPVLAVATAEAASAPETAAVAGPAPETAAALVGVAAEGAEAAAVEPAMEPSAMVGVVETAVDAATSEPAVEAARGNGRGDRCSRRGGSRAVGGCVRSRRGNVGYVKKV
ncbi:unnamed protein product [Phaeothamnion confervicola]